MKRIIAIIYIVLLCGCNFLEIDTPGIVNKDKMFENEQGFIDAMNGVYASFAKADLYGEKLSFGFIDQIAQLYFNDYDSYDSYETVLRKTIDLKYKDPDVRAQIDAIWAAGYNAISSINSILENASDKKFPLIPRIKAEALTLRAFMHFDLLRLFAPNWEKKSELAIPYVTQFSISPTPRSTVEDVYNHILQDLHDAEVLLTNAEPDKRRMPQVLFITLPAVHAIQARVYIWSGEKQKAAQHAQEALKGNYKLTNEETMKSLFLGYLAKEECIWGLEAPKMYFDMKRILHPSRLSESLCMVRDRYEDIYQVSSFTASNNDYRHQAFFTRIKWEHPVVMVNKFYDKAYEEFGAPSGRIPGINMLRLSELYYILAEANYDDNRQLALEYLNKVVTGRGLLPLKMEDVSQHTHFLNRLINEINKEYWGEGQLFFTNKRFHQEMIGVNGKIHLDNAATYILPLPEDELLNGIN